MIHEGFGVGRHNHQIEMVAPFLIKQTSVLVPPISSVIISWICDILAALAAPITPAFTPAAQIPFHVRYLSTITLSRSIAAIAALWSCEKFNRILSPLDAPNSEPGVTVMPA